MSLIFNKTIQTAKGLFKAGQMLPGYLSGTETVRQFREQYGEDIFIESADASESFAEFGKELTEIKVLLREIAAALNVKQANGESGMAAAQTKRPGRSRKQPEAALSA